MVMQFYIVYLGSLPMGEYSPTSHHLSVLEEIVEGSDAWQVLSLWSFSIRCPSINLPEEGMPSARISAYKVCGPASCQSSDILSAFDDAIADGVDIITIAIGESHAHEFDSDVIAIGGFHSMEKGILTLQSAGNEGPVPGSVASVAPWIFTVAASSTDRRIIDKVVLGNGKTLVEERFFDKLNAVKSYLNSTKKPLKVKPVRIMLPPQVASFSSRSPNPIISDILKPDASAPGVDILAAFPSALSPTEDAADKRHVKYSLMSVHMLPV
ncbi:SUBTILISIN-LIKE PROTEASE SBT4.3 [Salix koriyanagi]|uniref:SUBTILISIN-LIKE PROTEASE SBT4.3 n=1 Tax=Salix koriyanagi TaxID=2511006 RepID=A0A9Q0YZN7_9ROSI|nr:SUBTILISIN-LIKE PROTEASE SBT4.3 [Salix koriyanagi]